MTEHRFECDLAVVGGGPAGLAAASTAAGCGQRVVLLDETPWLGGQIWRGEKEHPASTQAQLWLNRFARSGAQLLDQTTVIAFPAHGSLLAERGGQPLQVRWNRLVLATGGRELFLPFPGWTLPGIFGPGGLQALIKHGWPVAGKRAVVVGSGPLLFVVADTLRSRGARVVVVAEQAPWERIFKFGLSLGGYRSKLAQALTLKLRLLGIPYRCGLWPVRAEGEEAVQSVTLTNGHREWTHQCELLACGFGLVPNLELPLALGCDLNGGFVRVDEFQATSVPNVYCAGEPTGIGGADCALFEGQIAGYATAGQSDPARELFARRATWHRFRSALANTFELRHELTKLPKPETLFCRCEDVSFGAVRQFASWREAKLHSRCGMGACQGRVCGAAAKVVLGWGMESVRPPIVPARVGSLVAGTPKT